MAESTIYLEASDKMYASSKQFLARILGKDAKYGYCREFCGKKEGSVTECYVTEPGLYELGLLNKKGRKLSAYRIIVAHDDGLIALKAEGDNADGIEAGAAVALIARRLDAGEPIGEIIAVEPREDGSLAYRIRNKAEAKKAVAVATIDSAVAACWAAIGAMDEKSQKAVLKALKERVSPPKAKEASAAAEPAADVAAAE